MSSTVGMRLRMTIYGESHGPSIGIVLDGLPPNITIDLGAIEKKWRGAYRVSPRFPHIGRKRINLLLKVVFLKGRRPEWLYVPAL